MAELATAVAVLKGGRVLLEHCLQLYNNNAELSLALSRFRRVFESVLSVSELLATHLSKRTLSPFQKPSPVLFNLVATVLDCAECAKRTFTKLKSARSSALSKFMQAFQTAEITKELAAQQTQMDSLVPLISLALQLDGKEEQTPAETRTQQSDEQPVERKSLLQEIVCNVEARTFWERYFGEDTVRVPTVAMMGAFKKRLEYFDPECYDDVKLGLDRDDDGEITLYEYGVFFSADSDMRSVLKAFQKKVLKLREYELLRKKQAELEKREKELQSS
ncbi:hypothetical protein HK104_011508, partial [Borealophlyctis nickersoniae]